MVFSCSTVDEIIEMVNNSDVPQEVKCLHIRANVWLAPFDFGIMQKVAVAFCRSVEDTGYLEIRILLERLSGEANAWRRINKAFLHELRKTLLVWRSLDAASKEHYENLIAAEGEKRGIDVGRNPETMNPRTPFASRKRTSVLAGWTFTSTPLWGNSRHRPRIRYNTR